MPVTPQPARPPRPASSSRPLWLAPLLVVGLLAALAGGALAAYLATNGDNPSERPAKQRRPQPVTVTQQETLPGATVVQTITTTLETEPAQAPPPQAPASVSVDEAVALTDQATGYLGSGDWQNAWSTVKPALRPLTGTYSGDFRYEAYAYYDAGKALAELGRCGKALTYLNHSESLQGSRAEIDDAQATCGG